MSAYIRRVFVFFFLSVSIIIYFDLINCMYDLFTCEDLLLHTLIFTTLY